MFEPDHHRICKAVGIRVREIRRERGISQQDLATLAEIHITSLGKIELGKGNPKLDTLARLALALDTSIVELVKDVTADIVQPKPAKRITAKDLIAARRKQEFEKGA